MNAVKRCFGTAKYRLHRIWRWSTVRGPLNLGVLLMGIAGIGLVIMSMLVFVSLQHYNFHVAGELRQANEQIDDLRSQLADEAARLAAAQQTSSDVASCRNLFDSQTTELFRIATLDSNALVVAIATTPPPPATERATVVAKLIQQLDADTSAAQVAQQAKKDWVAGGQKLPCPTNAD